MLTGYTANLPTDVLLNMGVLFQTLTGVSTKVGVTVGAPDFDPGIDLKDVTFDGMRCRLKGLTRRVGFKPIVKFNLKEFGGPTSGNQISLLEPGSTNATSLGTTTFTPKPAGAVYASADYAAGLRWIFERGAGGYAAIYFPIALVTKWTMKGADKDEATISGECEAVGDPAADLGVAPYLIELRTALPA